MPLVEDEAAAGMPAEITEEHIKEMLHVPKTWAHRGAGPYRAVSIRGTSMTPLLHPGDIVCIDTLTYDIGKLRGKLVAARVEEEGGVVIKRLDRKSTSQEFILLSENAEENPPIVIKEPKHHVLIDAVVWMISQKL